MSGVADLRFAVQALQMRLLSRAQLIEGASAWLNEIDLRRLSGGEPKPLRAFLVELGFLGADAAESVNRALEADAGSPSAVDPDVRRELVDLRPPHDVLGWLFSLPDRAPSPTAFRPLPRDERYQVGSELGRGGLGIVLEGLDRHLGRDIAMKVVHGDLTQDVEERLVREARITAKLDHPNIVPVHDFDEMPWPDGRRRLVLCMKRIRGRDLGSLLAAIRRGEPEARRWTRARLLAIFQDICLGVAYAQSKGVLHRDLKPSNVMIGDFGETLIVDWGLAKDLGAAAETRRKSGGSAGAESDPGLTTEGELLGTPMYMSPEQAAGRHADIDGRSDVFSLGGILYTILTYRPPFQGNSREQVIQGVLSGKVELPSRMIERSRADVPVATPESLPEYVPEELEAICLKALAPRPEDRYPGAIALHDDIQLFLEGVKERERTETEARQRVANGRGHFRRYRDLAGEIQSQAQQAKDLLESVKPWQPADEKRPLWEAQARLNRLEEERIEAFAAASAEFGQALAVRGDSTEALDAKCELFFDRFLEAEAKRDRKEMLLNRRIMESFDREGRYRARLEAPGRLTIRTFAFSCGCLAPVRHPEWRVEIAETTTIPWRDGRARPDLALTDRDCPVPAVRTFPQGVRWGHTAECSREEIRGAEVWIARYEERDRRFQLSEPRLLGTTPLAGAVLPQGSWRCTLKSDGFADTLLPVRIDRNGAWTQDVNLYRPADIPDDFCYLPGGPFIFAGAWAGGGEAETRTTEDVFVSRFATTCAEYLEFLNDLCRRGNAEEARRRQPRDGVHSRWIEEGGRFRLPSPAEDPKMAWEPRWPVFSINWFDAVAYCGWRSAKDGRVYRLLHEEEWEKAARGVDGRVFSYGDEHEGSYSHMHTSIAGKMTPMSVEAFPTDESPSGLRGLSGCIQAWCLNPPEVPFRDWKCLRGGSWAEGMILARAATRRGDAPANPNWGTGVRLVAAPRCG